MDAAMKVLTHSFTQEIERHTTIASTDADASKLSNLGGLKLLLFVEGEEKRQTRRVARNCVKQHIGSRKSAI